MGIDRWTVVLLVAVSLLLSIYIHLFLMSGTSCCRPNKLASHRPRSCLAHWTKLWPHGRRLAKRPETLAVSCSPPPYIEKRHEKPQTTRLSSAKQKKTLVLIDQKTHWVLAEAQEVKQLPFGRQCPTCKRGARLIPKVPAKDRAPEFFCMADDDSPPTSGLERKRNAK